MKTLLKGGTVIDGEGMRILDVLIEDEKIVECGECLSGGEEIDVSGKLLFPGFIDAHTHFDLEVAGTVTADDFSSGSRAAILGGTTTVIDFATQYRGESLTQALENWKVKASNKAFCDYGFHMAISDWNGNISDEIAEMVRAGVTSFKLYMTYDDMIVSDKEIYGVLRRLKEAGGIAGVHCENDGLIKALVEQQKGLGHYETAMHAATRPPEAEAEAISRLLRIAEVADAPVIIVHLSSKAGYEEVLRARKRGQKVYVETCPQYLLLDKELYELPLPDCLKYAISPPLRARSDRECLWDALSGDQIQTVSTDHCSFNMKQKMAGEHDFTKIPCGMPGVQERAELLYTYGVAEGKLTLPQLCRLLSDNPAKLYGLYPRKGRISEGSDADIVVFDPGFKGEISSKSQASRSYYAPFEGYEVKGRIERVYLRGCMVVDDGKAAEQPDGIFLKRGSTTL